MQLGLVGLGRMGAGIAGRLVRHGHAIVGFDVSHKNVARAVGIGATGVGSLQELVTALEAPRHVWLMVPSGKPTRETIEVSCRCSARMTSSSTGAIPSISIRSRTPSAATPPASTFSMSA